MAISNGNNLDALAREIPILDHAIPDPMRADKWLLSSAMQKAIRRGEYELAAQAAHGLWLADRQNFWRRLHVTSLEDVGIGDLEAVGQTLSATTAFAWRRKLGDLNVGLHLVKKLCASRKSRIADELLLYVERAPHLHDHRQNLTASSDEELASLVMGTAAVETRCLAAWLLAGTRKYSSDFMQSRQGDPDHLVEAISTLKGQPDLVEACLGVMHRTQWPLAVFTPIIAESVQHELLKATEQKVKLAQPVQVDGVPAYACDMFTRTGQAAFRRLQKTIPDLKPFTIHQIGLATFYREGGLLNWSVGGDFFDRIRQQGEMADIERTGLAIPEYLTLRQIMDESADLLDEVRCEMLQRALQKVAA